MYVTYEEYSELGGTLDEKSRKAKSEGTEVTSFNNGVNSFSFGGGDSSETTAAEASAYHEVCRMLPVELVSACVAYNDAR